VGATLQSQRAQEQVLQQVLQAKEANLQSELPKLNGRARGDALRQLAPITKQLSQIRKQLGPSPLCAELLPVLRSPTGAVPLPEPGLYSSGVR
jgi:hypothetical protein